MASAFSETLPYLICPECHSGALRPADGKGGLTCAACGAAFAAFGQVPALVLDAPAQRKRWEADVDRMLRMLTQALERVDQDLARFDLLPKTRTRLELLRGGIADNHQRLEALFAGAGISPNSAPSDASVDGVSPNISLTENYPLLMRDWGWPHTKENQRAAAQALECLDSKTNIQRIAVFGAGGCRLSYDLHQALKPKLSIAIDNNPLLALAAQQVLQSGELTINEFPLAPSSSTDCVMARTLKRPGSAFDNLHVILADARHPPLLAGAFDLIVTPWFIDVLGDDIREQLGLIHDLLPEGGIWLNHGPLIHGDQQPARQRYAIDEVWELIRRGGFELAATRKQLTEHLVVPEADRGRLETVHTFCAVKQPAASVDDGEDPPSWLLLPHIPIPIFRGLAEFREQTRYAGGDRTAVQHPTVQRSVQLINGEHSLYDVTARLLDEELISPDDAAVQEVGALLYSVYTSCVRKSSGA